VLVVSIGCPSGIGPEVSVAAAARFKADAKVLVGDLETIEAAARLVGVSPRRLARFEGKASDPSRIYVHAVGSKLAPSDRRPGRPTPRGGAAQLAWIDSAFDLARDGAGRALVTGPVSKEAIARSGVPRAAKFIGHTEWLCRRDRAKRSVMCFASDELATSLVTTHLPLARVPRALSPAGVSEAIVELGRLLAALGHEQPTLAVCSLNPHAGEGELFGDEERRAIAPGIAAARRVLGRRARVLGPIGAETAYRKAKAGEYAGVVAMYHDQATIPMKLVSFGDAVNVTMGLSIVRTSVDHGTAYDIAWRGRADPAGMLAAMVLAAKLLAQKRS
jgi:4-hydroxythreonine-4-phosphate dehydrogenase